VQSPWTGLILSSLLRPPIARCRTRPPSRPSQLHCPLQDEVLSTVLSIALYRTRSSPRSSPSPWTGLILSSLTGPPLALYRTRPSSRSSLHCPLQDEALQTVLSIALYRTRSSSRPSPLPSTGPGPLHILLKQED
jgi:hypothetical protein